MFDQILDLVKEQMRGNPQVAGAIPKEREDEIQREVATQVNQGLEEQAVAQGGVGGLLSQLSDAITSGSPLTNAIQGGLVGALGSKLGLSPAATGAIAAALPGILKKFANKLNDPDDQSITPESISRSLGQEGSFGNPVK